MAASRWSGRRERRQRERGKAAGTEPGPDYDQRQRLPELDAHPKLLEASLPVVINSDYLEQSPLGRAEWGIFIAAFFDLEEQAAQDFDALVQRYEAAKKLTEALRKKVSVFTFTDYRAPGTSPAARATRRFY